MALFNPPISYAPESSSEADSDDDDEHNTSCSGTFRQEAAASYHTAIPRTQSPAPPVPYAMRDVVSRTQAQGRARRKTRMRGCAPANDPTDNTGATTEPLRERARAAIGSTDYVPPLYTLPGATSVATPSSLLAPDVVLKGVAPSKATSAPLFEPGERDEYIARAQEFMAQHKRALDAFTNNAYYQFLQNLAGCASVDITKIIANWDSKIGRKQRLASAYTLEALASALKASRLQQDMMDGGGGGTVDPSLSSSPPTKTPAPRSMPWLSPEVYEATRTYAEELAAYNRQLLMRNAAVDWARAQDNTLQSGVIELTPAAKAAIQASLHDIKSAVPRLAPCALGHFITDPTVSMMLARVAASNLDMSVVEKSARDFRRWVRPILVNQYQTNVSDFHNVSSAGPGGALRYDYAKAGKALERTEAMMQHYGFATPSSTSGDTGLESFIPSAYLRSIGSLGGYAGTSALSYPLPPPPSMF